MTRLITIILLSLFCTVYADDRTPLGQLSSEPEQSQFDCAKKYCKYMDSCDEACYKLMVCDHTRLDRDKDGIPCENVCSTPCK